MTEAVLLANVVEACRWLGLHCYHTHDSRRSVPGFPDLVIAGPGGVLFRELKAASRLSRQQSDWITALARAGADVTVWRPEHWPEPIMTRLRELKTPTCGPCLRGS